MAGMGPGRLGSAAAQHLRVPHCATPCILRAAPSVSTRCESVAFLIGALPRVFIPFILKWSSSLSSRTQGGHAEVSRESRRKWRPGREPGEGGQLEHTTLSPLLHACGLATVDRLQETLKPWLGLPEALQAWMPSPSQAFFSSRS